MIEHKTCTDCGAEIAVEIPDSMSEKWAAMVRGWGTICNACDERREAEREAADAARQAQQRDRLYRGWLKRSEIPSALRGVEWTDLDSNGRRGAVLAAKRWAAGELPGLLLTGDVGVGKTTIAAAAAWARLKDGPVRWSSVPTLMARLGSGFSDPSRKAALELLSATDPLVLDDLDKTRPSEYAAEQLFNAIDGRITAGAQLLITTNLMPDRLADKFPDPFGESLASRLAGECEIHGVSGADRRIADLRAA